MLQNNGATGDRSEELKNRRPSRPRGAPGGHAGRFESPHGYRGPGSFWNPTRVDQLYKNRIEQQNATELTEWALGCHPLVSSACEQQKPNSVHSCGISSAAF